MNSITSAAADPLAVRQEIEELDLLVGDINGILRGKRVPMRTLERIRAEGIKLPLSVMAQDVWGEDVYGSGLVWETGDQDGVCRPVANDLVPVPWADRPRAQIMMTMFAPDGTPFMADPRQILTAICERFRQRGLTPVVATELEFYLMRGDVLEKGRPRPPVAPCSGYPVRVAQMFSMDELEEFSGVLTEIRDVCAAQKVPGDTIIVESGPGQFEINLEHVPNPVAAADHAVLFRRIVRKVAQRHGMHATFMAKPYGEQAGSGMHVHCSLLDGDGANVFDDGSDEGSDILRHAAGGVLATMAPSMLIFAPHSNSYRRFQPGSHAPTTAVWGYENRTAALRIPNGDHAARRIEHRVAGADANPYLVVATVLAGILHGLDYKIEPGRPVDGNAYDRDDPAAVLPTTWGRAIDRFEESSVLRSAFGDLFVDVYSAMKRQEFEKFSRRVTDVEYATYLGFF